MNVVTQLLQSWWDLIYPPYCAACEATLTEETGELCLNCLTGLPVSGITEVENNWIAQELIEKVPPVSGHALYSFRKGNNIQRLIHNIKYRKRPQAAYEIGLQHGAVLKSTTIAQADAIVPVPMAAKRLSERGYNQAQLYAEGLAKTMEIPLQELLLKDTFKTSQTKLGREQRYQNVADSMHIPEPNLVVGKHLIIADDVFTTGATMAACARLLFDAGAKQISVVTMAIARG
jgi:ComF family protein